MKTIALDSSTFYISIHILSTVCQTFPFVVMWKICLTIISFFIAPHEIISINTVKFFIIKYRRFSKILKLAVSLSIRYFLFAKSSHFERQVNSCEIYPFLACCKMRPIQILASKTLLVYFASVTVSANGEYM